MIQLYVYLQNFLRREEGQDLAEYAILIGLIAIAVIGAVLVLGDRLELMFREFVRQLRIIPGG